MYILMSIFALSLLGTSFMIGYKTMVLRRYGVAEAPGGTPPLTAQAHSLEHHLGAFLRTHAKRFIEGGFSWIKAVCIPVIIRSVKSVITFIAYIIRYIGTTVSHRIHSLENGSVPPSGASSFFLKDITEHKKNLKNGNEH